MTKTHTFNSHELHKVDEAVAFAEELVSNYFKMSSGQWLRIRYDVKTAEQLNQNEIVDGPFAQVVGYEGRKKNAALGSSAFDYYAICLQDKAILETIKKEDGLMLFPFLVYIVIHELVHIVRFGQFQQMYESSSESECTMNEEKMVHELTWKIVSKQFIPGMDKILEHYKKWVQ